MIKLQAFSANKKQKPPLVALNISGFDGLKQYHFDERGLDYLPGMRKHSKKASSVSATLVKSAATFTLSSHTSSFPASTKNSEDTIQPQTAPEACKKTTMNSCALTTDASSSVVRVKKPSDLPSPAQSASLVSSESEANELIPEVCAFSSSPLYSEKSEASINDPMPCASPSISVSSHKTLGANTLEQPLSPKSKKSTEKSSVLRRYPLFFFSALNENSSDPSGAAQPMPCAQKPAMDNCVSVSDAEVSAVPIYKSSDSSKPAQLVMPDLARSASHAHEDLAAINPAPEFCASASFPVFTPSMSATRNETPVSNKALAVGCRELEVKISSESHEERESAISKNQVLAYLDTLEVSELKDLQQEISRRLRNSVHEEKENEDQTVQNENGNIH